MFADSGRMLLHRAWKRADPSQRHPRRRDATDGLGPTARSLLLVAAVFVVGQLVSAAVDAFVARSVAQTLADIAG
jgi:hypothetical protein